MVHSEKATCIKGLFWLPYEAKYKICFSPICSYKFIRAITDLHLHLYVEPSNLTIAQRVDFYW